MKSKNFLCVAASALLLTSSAPAFAAESNSAKVTTDSFSSMTFSKPVQMDDTAFAELNRSATLVSPEKNQFTPFYQPELVSPNWSYTGLYPSSYIDTLESYYVSTDYQQVIIKAVQYPNSYFTTKTSKASYQLVAISGGQTTTPYQLDGNYTSTAATFSFYNVRKGTYKLRIFNVTSGDNAHDMAGNGYVYYY